MSHWQESLDGDELRIRFTAWLRTLIRRARIDYIRKNQKKIDTVSLDAIFDVNPERNEFAEEFSTGESIQNAFDFENEKVMRAFLKLSPVRKQILTMSFVEGLEPEEIARSLNCAVENVYNKRSLALKALRELLAKEGNHEG